MPLSLPLNVFDFLTELVENFINVHGFNGFKFGRDSMVPPGPIQYTILHVCQIFFGKFNNKCIAKGFKEF